MSHDLSDLNKLVTALDEAEREDLGKKGNHLVEAIKDRIGSHDLIIGAGDESLHASCWCGKSFGSIRPDKSVEDGFLLAWERHIMTETTNYPEEI